MKRIEYCEKCKGNPYYVIKPGQGRKYRCPKPGCESYLRDTYVEDDELRRKYIPMSVYLMMTEDQISKRVGDYPKTQENCRDNTISKHIEASVPEKEPQVQAQTQVGSETSKADESKSAREHEHRKDKSDMPAYAMSPKVNNATKDRLRKKKDKNQAWHDKGEEQNSQSKASGEPGSQMRFIRENNRYIKGEVMGASRSDTYPRSMWEKLSEKIRYRQRMSDVHNTVKINVCAEDGNLVAGDYVEVIFHGEMRGGLDVISQGAKIEAFGKMVNGGKQFYAHTINYDDKPVKLAIESSDSLVVVMPILVVALFVLLWQLIPDGMTFLQGMAYFKDLVVRFFIWDIILTGMISILLYIYTRRGLSSLMRRLPEIPYRRCFWLGLALSTVITALIVF